MIEYTYKLVSAVLGGSPDWEALKRAAAAGWEPVPAGEEPEGGVNPLEMTAEQLANFRLHRMPVEVAERRQADLRELNAALEDHRVAVLIGRRNIRAEIAEMREKGIAVHPRWNIPADEVDEMLLRRVELAHEFLRKRGLA